MASDRFSLRRAGPTWLALTLLTALHAITAQADTIDFESIPVGQTVGALPGVTIAHGEPGIDLVVAAGLQAPSGNRYLGASHTLRDSFLAGDALELQFAEPVQQLSLAIASTPATPAAAFELDTPEGTVTSGALPNGSLAGDELYVLSLSTGSPISNATLRSTAGVFAFHVDDLSFEPVPEPASALLLACGAVFLARVSSRTPSLRRR